MSEQPRFVSKLVGDDAISIRAQDLASLRLISSKLRSGGDWLEVVDGIEDVTLLFDPATLSPDEALEKASDLEVTQETRSLSRQEVELSVQFGGENGPDMKDVCDQLEMSQDELISTLSESDLQVDMIGFTPGFAYISGLPEALSVPRLKQPRARVPAGSLGLAAGRCGTYALEGPGGWPIIGKISTPLFDKNNDPPFVLQAGMRVKLINEADQ